ncbi:hypothetical protein [Arthrobacter sp. ZGTC412]|uniref:hypothetical protein n=1 Tax=Arthrobacter sp. ZGTC412 TaxID=2058900 RepID=UPI000CE4803B|nr:hypothetical protein [Arthrobacter sp. ZGTC412]
MARGRPLLRAPHDGAHQLKSVLSDGAVFVRDWTTLEPGQLVVVREEFAREMRGRVDTVTEDGDVLWLHLEGGGGRRLFTGTGGDRVWRVRDDVLPGL